MRRSCTTTDAIRRHHIRRQTPHMAFPIWYRTMGQTYPVTPQKPEPFLLQSIHRHVQQDVWCWHQTCFLYWPSCRVVGPVVRQPWRVLLPPGEQALGWSSAFPARRTQRYTAFSFGWRGALTHEGAQLLVQQCVPCIHDAEWGVQIDLTAVTFIDEAAAAVVRRLSQSPSVSLTGCQLFTQQMIEAVPPVEGCEVQ